MRGSSLGLFIVVLVVIITVAEAEVKKCYTCFGDCKNPEAKPCGVEDGSSATGSEAGSGSSKDSPSPAESSPPEEARKKRQIIEFSCTKSGKDGFWYKACKEKKVEACKQEDSGDMKCYCNSDLCNGSSLPKSISVWGLGIVALLVVLNSSKLL